MRVAFALAGLGGFNAHGAGFLAAASTWGIKPELVSATSGQIMVLADWLAGRDVRTHLTLAGRGSDPSAQLRAIMFGHPGVFRPAYGEAFARLTSPPNLREGLFSVFADRLLPAQQYVPELTDKEFADVAETFNTSRVGVLFNSYDPKQGIGFLYGNDVARTMLPSKKALPNAHALALKQSRHRHDMRYVPDASRENVIHPITAAAIKSALWLSLYGFHYMPAGQMDGAYHRSCIVSELHEFDRIFVARPLADGWHGKEPANWFEVQDWVYEMWFSVGYKAEVTGLRRINDLIEAGVIPEDKFRKVELIEIEPETPAGYFHYFVERKDVYEEAVRVSEETFASLGLPRPEQSGRSA